MKIRNKCGRLATFQVNATQRDEATNSGEANIDIV